MSFGSPASRRSHGLPVAGSGQHRPPAFDFGSPNPAFGFGSQNFGSGMAPRPPAFGFGGGTTPPPHPPAFGFGGGTAPPPRPPAFGSPNFGGGPPVFGGGPPVFGAADTSGFVFEGPVLANTGNITMNGVATPANGVPPLVPRTNAAPNENSVPSIPTTTCQDKKGRYVIPE
ncbi:MAG: hypothetical protein SGARI_004689, partial [Bacillariaceae sp.]